MQDWAIENLFLSFNLSCFLSVYFNFGGQTVDKKQRALVPKTESSKKGKVSWESNLYFKK